MIKIIAPTQFKQLPWKNGKGVTTELAISPSGHLGSFEWRLSIASVSEDGAFSDFSGYERNLILIEGDGLRLEHQITGEPKQIHPLNKLLDFSNVDGAAHTEAFLNAGAIKDFNVIVDPNKYQTEVFTFTKNQRLEVEACDWCFVYSLNDSISLYQSEALVEQVAAGHLLQLSETNSEDYQIESSHYILVKLKKIG